MALWNNLNAPTPFSVANGGTGATSLTANGIVFGNGTSAVTVSAELSDGQVLVGRTGNTPVPATITAGANVTVTNASGSITIAASDVAGMVFSAITENQGAVAEEGYITNGGATRLEVLLPAAPSVGDRFRMLYGNGAWRVTQNAGDTVSQGTQESTAGATGYFESNAVGDGAEFICIAAQTWRILSPSTLNFA